jgi:hypothetical protein
MILTGENRRTCPSATSSTTNPMWTDPDANPALSGERPATNRLSHGTASTFPSCDVGGCSSQSPSHRPL